jgi:uncharacterized membrane protein YgcG
MNCPACDHSLTEHATACPRCGFSLAQCDAHFGNPPAMQWPVTDPAGLLSRMENSKVRTRLLQFARQFPQAKLTLLILPAPADTSPRPWLFWLFNRSSVHAPLEKGGVNRHILLWIDPETRVMRTMVGYGLEPILPPRVMEEALAAAGEAAREGRFAAAAQAFAEAITEGLAAARAALPAAAGWFAPGKWIPAESARVSS